LVESRSLNEEHAAALCMVLAVMVAMTLIGLSFIPYYVIDGKLYRITMLHVPVLFAGVLLPLRHALAAGIFMGFLSIVYAVYTNPDALSFWLCVNLLAPRAVLALYTSLAWRRLAGWSRRVIAMCIVAATATFIHTTVFTSLMIARVTFFELEYERASLALSPLDCVRIAMYHLVPEAGFATMVMALAVHLARKPPHQFCPPPDPEAKVASIRDYKANPVEVFISFAASDREAAARLFGSLSALNVDAFFSDQTVPLGVDWDECIRLAAIHADHFVVVVGREPARAYYMRAEVANAIQAARQDRARRVIPIALNGVSLSASETPFGLSLKQGLNASLTDDADAVAVQIRDAIRA
jgi:uncharacterized membrane protein